MKKLINHLFFLVCLLFATDAAAISEEYPITVDQALSIVKKSFSGQDVDYYLDSTISGSGSNYWYIFVDAEPMKGWEHDCYSVRVRKTITTTPDKYVPIKVKLRKPNNSTYIPLDVKNRCGNSALEKPNVIPNSNHYNAEAAKHTYAIILSGGINKNANYERYWNDCSFIFQTLKRTYGIPQSNITVIMSDGTSPQDDMLTYNGRYKSSPLDLDNDGTNDIKYSATEDNIKNVLTNLTYEMQRDDHLFFYVIDHGGTDDFASKSYINLWGEGNKLYDYKLAEYLTPLVNKGVSVNAVLGQCFAGGFVDDLSEIGCIVATACTGSESSYACPNLLYDEFVYNWTSAINGSDTQGNITNADFNNDGHTTMVEAFLYAKYKDYYTFEHPQFYAGEADFGNHLSFKSLPLSDDIYIKDNPADVGDEPNLTTDRPWNSPSIAIRNSQDSLCVYENPYYSKEHPYAFVYVMVHNKGKKTYPGGDFVYVNWVNASLGITPKAWNGEETYNDKQTGGVLECSKIKKPILPGDSAIVELGWFLPSSLRDSTEGRFHYCLYARIQDKTTTTPIPYEDFRPTKSKKEAQRNLTIIRKSDTNKALNVFMRNLSDKTRSYTLELVPRTVHDRKLFSVASVQMGMTPKVYAAWERGGCQAIDAEPIASLNNNEQLKRVKLLSINNKIKEVKLNANEFDVVNIKFNFNQFANEDTDYCYDLIQRDADGNIVGGETIIIEQPRYTHIGIMQAHLSEGITELSVDDSDIENVTWYNGNGETIGSTPVLTVNTTTQGKDFSVSAVTNNGDVALSSITLDDFYGIEGTLQSADDLVIRLKAGASDNSSIELISLQNGAILSSSVIPCGETTVNLNVSSIPKGSYLVRYLIGSDIIDSVKVSLK